MKDSIGYQGKITIKVKNKPPKKIKNRGTIELFSSLCQILGGKDLSESITPAYMSIIKDSVYTSQLLETEYDYSKYMNDTIMSSATSKLPIQTSMMQSDGSIVFTSTVSRNQLISDKSSSYYLLLLTKTGKILAFSKFDATALSAVREDANSQGIIEWNMSFTNATEDTEG